MFLYTVLTSSKMIFHFLIIFFAVVGLISANPVLSSWTEDITSAGIDDDSSHVEITGEPECIEGVSQELGIDQTVNLVRRLQGACPAGSLAKPGPAIPGTTESWRAPKTISKVNVDHDDQPDKIQFLPGSRMGCANDLKPWLYTCSGPGIRYNFDSGSVELVYVLNCVPGKCLSSFTADQRLTLWWVKGYATEISARSPWPHSSVIAYFCCHKHYNYVRYSPASLHVIDLMFFFRVASLVCWVFLRSNKHRS